MFVTIVAALALSTPPANPVLLQRRRASVQRKAKPVNETPGIMAGFRDVERAFETKNWNLLRSRMTSNFKQELPNKQVLNQKQCVAQLRKEFAPLSDIKVTFNTQVFEVKGSTGTASNRFMVKAKMKDKKGSHNVRMEGSETVTLRKVRGKWLGSYVKTHDMSVAIDGRIVSHMP